MIEATATRKHRLGMPPATFLRRHWQKQPLLIRGAFPDFESPISPNDLAGLAGEPMAISRLVVHRPKIDRWNLRNGPFTADDFAHLPKSHWTLLVQDCDKAFAEIDALLAHFRFLPDWRIDDIMISYAVDGGSVGAHVDQYDVFLLQGMGRRRWQISTDPAAPKDFRPDVELKQLRRFKPTHEWILEPGDMLYLPPGVPHHGVALGECMTFSVGLRAPAVMELLADFLDRGAEHLPEERRYADPGLTPPVHAGEIDAGVVKSVGRLLRDAIDVDSERFADWFAGYMTRYRSAHQAAPRRRALDRTALRRKLTASVTLHRHPLSRCAWRRLAGGGARIFYGGQSFDCSIALAERLSAHKQVAGSSLGDLSGSDLGTLLAIVNAGHLEFGRDR